MPTHFEFRSILVHDAQSRDEARKAHRVLREAEIRQSRREDGIIAFTSLLGSDPVSDTDEAPPADGEA